MCGGVLRVLVTGRGAFSVALPGIRRVLSNRIAQNATALYAVQILSYIFPLISLPYLARVLEPHHFGLIAFAQSFANWLAVVGEYGFMLGFVPQWTGENGIQQVIDALRNGKVRDYRASIYSNVKYLTEDTAADPVKQYYLGWEKDLIERAQVYSTTEEKSLSPTHKLESL